MSFWSHTSNMKTEPTGFTIKLQNQALQSVDHLILMFCFRAGRPPMKQDMTWWKEFCTHITVCLTHFSKELLTLKLLRTIILFSFVFLRLILLQLRVRSLHLSSDLLLQRGKWGWTKRAAGKN